MQLDRLELENFRQFRDETIAFATGSDRNVTVVHGANGSGKTTLLNAFTWLFYGNVDFDTRPDRLASEGAMANAQPGDRITVSVQLQFEHEGEAYIAQREAIYEKRSATDFDGEMIDSEVTVKYRNNGSWKPRNNPENTLDQIIPERLSGLFFFDGEDIDELAGIDNQDRIQEAIQNIMGLTILERANRHLDTVAGRFEDEVDEYASDELSELISEKRTIEDDIEEFKRDRDDTQRRKERIESEIEDLEQKLERLDESAALQERREEYREDLAEVEDRIDSLDEDIKTQISQNGFVPLAMPLLKETATELDQMREEGVIPSELSNSFVDSLLDAGQCICGRPLEPGTDHYDKVASMRGDAVADGVEQSAIRIIGHLNEVSDKESEFFDSIDEIIEQRKDLYDRRDELEELIDEVSSELQGMNQTTESGQSIGELEAKREQKETEREEAISEIARIEERIERKQEELESLEEQIDEQQDEREEALLAKRRQKAAELVQDELEGSFEDLKDQVRQWSNKMIKQTFDDIASKDLTAEITDDFELKIWQDVGDERVEVDKSTGERQIASLAFIGSLVNIARERYESDSDSEYFTGGIYPLVMDSPFGALDKDHRRQVSKVIPSLANQVVVFATDSQWEGPVEEEMRDIIGEQYWLDFDSGEGEGEYPQTRIAAEQASIRGD
ncbi:AAA family ATPase [Halapricum desulfuricans]|uniref:ATPase involved in DNA repair, SbcC n=1 Tax=Halapricum desulfuricans TaxID=2841257 RepID=A0A897NM18_9EURY|nr:AAA family ATPase [Halapricum desulfuricans]QSG13738.1 ATPase involved in DNA repair, SbcC [Halapricum desulfuricans]